MKIKITTTIILATLLAISFAIANNSVSENQSETIEAEDFIDKQDYENPEFFPKEMSIEEADIPLMPPRIEKDTDEKGIYYEIHYDEFERAVKVEDYFIRGYRGVTEYEFFSELQLKEREGIQGYEWVISKETGTFYKNNEVIATRVVEFDKEGNKISTQKTGSTLMLTIIKLLSNFYNVPPPEEQ